MGGREMIGQGIFKVDDYARFGQLIEDLCKAGAYLVSYVPRENQIIVFARKKDAERIKAVLDGKEYDEMPLKNTLIMFKVRW